jgi:CBS domain containing-hemolysin-like protein
MNDLLALALLVVVVIAGSALCSGVEAALLSVNPVKLHQLASGPRPVRGARQLERLRQRLGRTLSVLVIGNNGFNIFGSLMLGGLAAQVFSHHGVEAIALPLFSVGLTVLVILLGEILPKAFGSRLALPVALATAPALALVAALMLPLVLLLERLLPAISAENEIHTDEEEIRLLARLGSQKGQIEADEAAMIAKVFQLNDLTARDLMTPRVSAPTLPGAARLDALRADLLANAGEWWVVLGEEVDEILGVASRERLLTALVQGQGLLTPAELSEPVEFVPEMIRADRLLAGFRRNSGGVRVVVDEFGGFVGMISAEAVLAVLAGWWRPRPSGPAEERPGTGGQVASP